MKNEYYNIHVSKLKEINNFIYYKYNIIFF